MKQAQFLLHDDIEEVMFGGAARGGKSDALLMCALQYVHIPYFRSLILRRNFADLALPGALMDRANDWLISSSANWNAKKHSWVFPSGATMTFGYLAHENHKYRYQGSDYHTICFDELTQFTQSQYEYLFSRQDREAGSPMPLKMRSATNPGGAGHKWVKKMLVDPATAGIRLFIKSRLEDNPHIDQVAYDRKLKRLDPVTRAQLRWGDWDILAAGNMFRPECWIIVQERPSTVQDCVRFWDLAATDVDEGGDPDFTIGTKIDRLPRSTDGEHQFCISSQVGGQLGAAKIEALVARTAAIDGHGVRIGIEQEGGASGKLIIEHYKKNVIPGYQVEARPSSGSKMVRASPLSAACENGYVSLLRGHWNEEFIEECAVFPNEAYHDDRVDSASGAHLMLVEMAGEGAFVGDPFNVRPG